jgi:hypothetical protein
MCAFGVIDSVVNFFFLASRQLLALIEALK